MPKKILVADDSPTIRNVANSLLRKHGYEVLSADDGAKALSMAKSEKPDLIFLSNSISVLDGEHVCRELKQDGSLKDIPVVIVLSTDEKETEQNLRRIGTNGFITRPFNPAEILDHAERLLKKDKTSPTGGEMKASEDLPSTKDEAGDDEEAKTAPPQSEDIKPEDSLNIVDPSDLVEDFDPSASASYEEVAHGFDWFLHELKKETQEDQKADSGTKEKPRPSEEKIESKEEGKIYEIGEHEKGYEEFLKDLKVDLGEPDKEGTPKAHPAVTEEVTPPRFDQLFSDLKEKIAERVAQEVAKKISPEFLEKIIREETAKMVGDSS